MAMYKPLQTLMDKSSGFLSQSSHRLDKYHLFSKPWKETVILKIGKCVIQKQKVKILQHKLERLFDYIETEQELKICIDDYKCFFHKEKNNFQNEAL